MLIGAALWALRDNLPSIVDAARSTHPRWGLVAIASLITLGAYAVLVESWRRVLRELGGHLAPAEAAIIWFGSNLARYLPGTGWQIGVMGAMAKERGVTITASTSASLLTSVLSILTGLAVCLVGLAALAVGPGAVPTLSRRAMVLVALGVIGLAASPWLMPRVARLASRLSGRELTLPRVSGRALGIAGAGTTIAWLAYGLAFALLAAAVVPGTGARSVVGCVTLYTFSYLVGWFNPMPAGIGVTEPIIVLLAPQLGVATTAEATVLALFVRAWRTAMEMGTGLAALGVAPVARARRPSRGE